MTWQSCSCSSSSCPLTAECPPHLGPRWRTLWARWPDSSSYGNEVRFMSKRFAPALESSDIDIDGTDNPEGVARRCRLPHNDFAAAWTSIALDAGVHERLLAQSLLSL